MKTFEADYDVRTFQVTPGKTLGLVSLLNLLQDVAWRHAELQGHGWEASARRGSFWVMTRQILEIDGRAQLGERVSVSTWLRAPKGSFVTRDFEVSVGSRPLARCAITFALIDAQTRRPRRDSTDFGDASVFSDRALALEPAKILPSPEARDLETFRVRNSDLDVNDHVNNVRYAAWILDAVPRENEARVRGYEICFLAEARLGDALRLQAAGTEFFQGARGTEWIFTARVRIS